MRREGQGHQAPGRAGLGFIEARRVDIAIPDGLDEEAEVGLKHADRPLGVADGAEQSGPRAFDERSVEGPVPPGEAAGALALEMVNRGLELLDHELSAPPSIRRMASRRRT
jgi:hypothetical protein